MSHTHKLFTLSPLYIFQLSSPSNTCQLKRAQELVNLIKLLYKGLASSFQGNINLSEIAYGVRFTFPF